MVWGFEKVPYSGAGCRLRAGMTVGEAGIFYSHFVGVNVIWGFEKVVCKTFSKPPIISFHFIKLIAIALTLTVMPGLTRHPAIV